MKHLAFTLVELIFAILIISIAVMSLPMMSQTATDSISESIVQEAIFGASTELNQIISYKWDENSTDGNFTNSRVIWTTANDCNQTTKLRPGHINQPKHRRCSENNFSVMQPSAFGFDSDDSNIPDDLDDLDGNVSSLFITSAGEETTSSGYKNRYTRTIDISDVAFGNPATVNNNMKEIKITIKESTTGEIVTVLKTYSANIGEVDYYSKVYP